MFVEGSEGGLDLLFHNKKTEEWTWYTPKGMTPEQIVQIPRARKYFTKEYAEQYIKRMAAERQRDAEEGSLDADVSVLVMASIQWWSDTAEQDCS
jgi:hypothetical protein